VGGRQHIAVTETLNSRYDVIPSDLILNNTVQIVYDEMNEPAQKVVVEGWPVLDDTDFVPVLKREMAPADIEYELNVWFDVSPSIFQWARTSLTIRPMTMEVIGDLSIMCRSLIASLPSIYLSFGAQWQS